MNATACPSELLVDHATGIASPGAPPRRIIPVRRAFTLIELLVVVSIITLLIAILLPSLAKARKDASTTVCKASIRGLDQALLVYLSTNDNTVPWNGILFPKSGGKNTAPTTGYGRGDPNMQHWDLEYGVLWDYVNQNRAAYLCQQDVKDGLVRVGGTNSSGVVVNLPLARDPNPTDPTPISVGGSNHGYWSYSINSVLNSEGQFRNNFLPLGGGASTQQPWIDPLKWTSIQRPSDFFVFIEEDINSPFNDEVFDAPAYNGGDKITNRHAGNGGAGGNVAYADGHVDFFSDVLFNQAPSAGSPSSQDNWTALQYPITRDFFPDGGQFATPP